MLLSAACGQDLCLIGPKGEGKTFLAQQLAKSLGHARIYTLFLHEEMTARDLFQRRNTNRQGESIWEGSPLLQAMERGGLCVLDGLQQLRPMTLAALAPLIQDREVTLYDGLRFLSPWRQQHLAQRSSAATSRADVRVTHPKFRVLALATPQRHAKGWLSNEILQLFHFFTLPRRAELLPVVSASVPHCPRAVAERLLQLRTSLLTASQDSSSPLWSGSSPMDLQGAMTPTVMLSLRSLLRAARLAAESSEIADYLQSDFLPLAERTAVQQLLTACGFVPRAAPERLVEAERMVIEAPDFQQAEPTLRIGSARCRVAAPRESALIPERTMVLRGWMGLAASDSETKFFDNPQQTLSLHDMLRDMAAGENLLLMGNQGVGKNKLIDRLLMLLHREREYIQLHRDTTVGSLTLVPTLRSERRGATGGGGGGIVRASPGALEVSEANSPSPPWKFDLNGLVCFDDSPLVKAMRYGRVLVIDEFDKAPTEVVLTLKGLLQDGEMILVDGRRFLRDGRPEDADAVGIHPKFQVVALANRPGFPFLGNDFFREMGDCFACHAIQNPDETSEVAMLRHLERFGPGLAADGKRSYAPSVPLDLLRLLSSCFGELRQMVEAGKLSYPYSTRELVNLVRHLETFPQDSLAEVLDAWQWHREKENVFAFDSFEPELRKLLRSVFERHGLPVSTEADASSGARGGQRLEPRWLGQLERLKRKCKGRGDFKTVSWAWHCSGSWQPLELHSARSKGFSEEDTRLSFGARPPSLNAEELWFRMGSVTKEGVLIQGFEAKRMQSNPLKLKSMSHNVVFNHADGPVDIREVGPLKVKLERCSRKLLTAIMRKDRSLCTKKQKGFYDFFCGLDLEVQKQELVKAGVYVYHAKDAAQGHVESARLCRRKDVLFETPELTSVEPEHFLDKDMRVDCYTPTSPAYDADPHAEQVPSPASPAWEPEPTSPACPSSPADGLLPWDWSTVIPGALSSSRVTREINSTLFSVRVQEQAGKLIKEAREPCFEEDIAEFLEKASEVNKVEKMKMELKDFDHAKYDELFKAVEKEILQLRVVLQSIEARERERTWLRGKVVGEFDDNKIVDLAIGEKNVFKRRGQREDRSLIQSLLKRLSFVVDVSGSMAVFNGDGRLDRLCATMVMIMESLCGLEHKYIYEIIGHSGESDWLPFVQMGQHPATRLERFAVVEAMTDHAATARSGDNTLAAGVKAVQEIVKEDADDYFVFLISDANLRGYGISAEDLAMALTGEVKVNAHAIFIAEPDAAEEMRRCMPQGHAHLVMETSGMPLLLKNIFARAVLATSNSKL
ncbi:von Willebrand factor A domain-containing protein 8 [Durusdinium trenchii]|uniref:von Willebrand factor A domain-containing protein 8 n=1 Tax=Durusdinium trenchii TaxID=1381693 RepID=A0ABP0LLG6_9DINO